MDEVKDTEVGDCSKTKGDGFENLGSCFLQAPEVVASIWYIVGAQMSRFLIKCFRIVKSHGVVGRAVDSN